MNSQKVRVLLFTCSLIFTTASGAMGGGAMIDVVHARGRAGVADVSAGSGPNQRLKQTAGAAAQLIALPDMPYVNVKDMPYNARGDGSTDDTAAIQAAINAAAEEGSNVYIPAMNGATRGYVIRGTLHITTPGVRVFGGGSRSVLWKPNGGDLLQIGDGVKPVSHVVISGLNFAGSDASGWSVRVRYAPRTFVVGNVFANPSTTAGALWMDYSWDSQITMNTIGSVKRHGIMLTNSMNAVSVVGNSISGISGQRVPGSVGCYVSGSYNVVFAANAWEALETGMEIGAGADFTVSDYFEGNYGEAGRAPRPPDIYAGTWSASSADGLVIQGSYFAPGAIGQPSIILDHVRGVRIGANTFREAVRYAGSPIKVTANAVDVEFDINGQNTEPREATLRIRRNVNRRTITRPER